MSTTLDQMGIEELKAEAQDLGVNLGALKNKGKIIEKIEAKKQENAIRERVRIEEEERQEIAKRQKDAVKKLGLQVNGRTKCFEDVEIEKSEVKRYRFTNVECAGEDVSFTLGTHRYHLFDGVEYELPVFVTRTLQKRCRLPIYKTPDKPDENGERRSQKVDDRPRFSFEEIGD